MPIRQQSEKTRFLRHLSERVGSKQHEKHDVESKDFASCFFHFTNYEHGGTTLNSNLTYTRYGDYDIPNVTLFETEAKPLGKYGRMRKNYLKEHRPILWNSMILSEKLYHHLREIDETANRRLEQLMPELVKHTGVTESLKASDPMKWRG